MNDGAGLERGVGHPDLKGEMGGGEGEVPRLT